MIISTRFRRSLIVLLALLSALPAAAQPTKPLLRTVDLDGLPRRLASSIDARIEHLVREQELVGLSVALIVDGQVADVRSVGWEDRDNEIPASAETMYRWASISKPLTAIAALQLVEAGKLDLDRDVRDYVPEFPEKPHPITARQLLCHQGGIVHYSNGRVIRTVRSYDADHPFESVVLALDTFKESPLVNEPGTAYAYTTHGYILLGAVVERAGEEKFADQVRTRIARPLVMTRLRPDYQWEEIPHSAIGYRRNPAGNIEPGTDTDVSWKLPGGGFISTVLDLGRFGAGLLRGELLEPETYDEMWAAQKTRDGEVTGYGLGFRVAEWNGERLIAHSGSQEKTRTMLMLLPDSKLGVALMCNTEHAQLREVASDILELLHEPAVAQTR